MNTNDIIHALMSNKINLSEVEQACEIVRNFINARSNLESAGVKVEVTTTFAFPNAPITSVHVQVANDHGITAQRIANFCRANLKIQAPGERFYNKIQLIKAFREEFKTGLADTKAIIEYIYGY